MTYQRVKIVLFVGFVFHIAACTCLSIVAFEWVALHRTFTSAQIAQEDLYIVWRDKHTTIVRFSNGRDVDVGDLPGNVQWLIQFGGIPLYPIGVLLVGNCLVFPWLLKRREAM